MLHSLRYDKLTCSIQIEAGIPVHVAHLGQAHHERRVSNDSVEALVLHGLEPRTLAKLNTVFCACSSDSSAGKLEGSLVNVGRNNFFSRLQLPKDLYARTRAQV